MINTLLNAGEKRSKLNDNDVNILLDEVTTKLDYKIQNGKSPKINGQEKCMKFVYFYSPITAFSSEIFTKNSLGY